MADAGCHAACGHTGRCAGRAAAVCRTRRGERRQRTGAACACTAQSAGTPVPSNAKQRGTGTLSSPARAAFPGRPGGTWWARLAHCGPADAGETGACGRGVFSGACSCGMPVCGRAPRALPAAPPALFAQNTCRAALWPVPLCAAPERRRASAGAYCAAGGKRRSFPAAAFRLGDGWLAWLCRRTRKVAARNRLPRCAVCGIWGLMPVLKQRGCALDAQTRIQTAFAEGKMSKMKNLEKNGHIWLCWVLPSCCCPRWRC